MASSDDECYRQTFYVLHSPYSKPTGPAWRGWVKNSESYAGIGEYLVRLICGIQAMDTTKDWRDFPTLLEEAARARKQLSDHPTGTTLFESRELAEKAAKAVDPEGAYFVIWPITVLVPKVGSPLPKNVD